MAEAPVDAMRDDALQCLAVSLDGLVDRNHQDARQGIAGVGACHTDGHVVYCVMGDGGDVDADVEGGGAHPSTAGVPTNDGGGGAGSLPTHRIKAVFTGAFLFYFFRTGD